VAELTAHHSESCTMYGCSTVHCLGWQQRALPSLQTADKTAGGTTAATVLHTQSHLIAAVAAYARHAIWVDHGHPRAEERALGAGLVEQRLAVLQGSWAPCEQALVLVIVTFPPGTCSSSSSSSRATPNAPGRYHQAGGGHQQLPGTSLSCGSTTQWHHIIQTRKAPSPAD